jgi:hypothetical protein
MEVATFTCSICGETSRDICVFCTKDACANHLCERCRRCSDCCQCEVALLELHEDGVAINSHFHGSNGHVAIEAVLEEEDEILDDDDLDDDLDEDDDLDDADEEIEGAESS